MRKISLPLAIALMIVSCVIGIGAGYWLTPQYRLSMYDKNTMDLGAPDKWLDLRYLDAMISHHRGAMLLAHQASQSKKKEISALAVDILQNEPPAIRELYRWKKEWYGDSRIVPDPQVPRIGRYDRTFDLRFLNALIAHHENGIRMTREIRLKSSRSEILDNADSVELFLHNGIGMLSEWRTEWYHAIDTNPLP
ncbi:MAG: DUF305 domain-containing protein [Chlorobiaceae bacterium]|nr:DUF305 domain-containing protein [Chlorobiaceae bacterium]NTV61426.1 DUF305 domain-containing protein [Chlorobiaceae bacterium]